MIYFYNLKINLKILNKILTVCLELFIILKNYLIIYKFHLTILLLVEIYNKIEYNNFYFLMNNKIFKKIYQKIKNI